jgi:hypothetical protein
MLSYFSPGLARDLAQFALRDNAGLRHMGPVVFALGCLPLKEALDRLDGRWPARYKAARDSA